MLRSQQQIESGRVDQGKADPFRHLSPVGQPESVHEISDALYEPFRGSGVSLHIAGCSIDAVPFVQAASGGFYLLSGQSVSENHALSLGLEQIDQRVQPPHEWTSAANRQKISHELEVLAKTVPLAEAADSGQWIIWCSHVHGTLMAESGSDAVSIPFSLWGARLIKGLDKCPPFQCPHTGRADYHLASDDEGRISGAGSIARCDESGRRLLITRLERCHQTGRRVDSDLLVRCPVEDELLLERLVQSCNGCFQKVDPASLVKGQCRSCRSLQRAKLADETLVELIQRHGWLTESAKIKIATQPRRWLLQVRHQRTAWRIVLDRQTLQICNVARTEGWLRPWQQVSRPDWPAFLSVADVPETNEK